MCIRDRASGAVYGETEAAAFDTAAEAGAGDGGLTSGTAIQPVNSSRKLIRTVNLDVETTEFDSLLATLTQTVASMGGYIEQSDISGNSISDAQGSRRYAWLTARVPSNKLDSFVSQADEKGNITNKSENTQDVTLQYSDIESRKKTLAVEQDRLWDLLAKACLLYTSSILTTHINVVVRGRFGKLHFTRNNIFKSCKT